MKYIIENARTYCYGQLEQKSVLIDDSKVVYSHSHFTHYQYMRVCTNQFVISPGHVMIDFTVTNLTHFQSFKERMTNLVSKGCTTFISVCDLMYESQFELQLKKAKHALINSTIDFIIGIKIPLIKLTPSLIRKCRKNKVPVIFVEINKKEEIDKIAWQRIRDELFPYHLLILPIWNMPDTPQSKLKKWKKDWKDTLTSNKITTDDHTPNEFEPLSKEVLLNIGLYPQKGSLKTRSDADYLFYNKDHFKNDTIAFTQHCPDIVIANGVVKKAGNHIFFKPGVGKELVIHIPRKFVPITKAFQPATISVDYY